MPLLSAVSGGSLWGRAREGKRNPKWDVPYRRLDATRAMVTFDFQEEVSEFAKGPFRPFIQNWYYAEVWPVLDKSRCEEEMAKTLGRHLLVSHTRVRSVHRHDMLDTSASRILVEVVPAFRDHDQLNA